MENETKSLEVVMQDFKEVSRKAVELLKEYSGDKGLFRRGSPDRVYYDHQVLLIQPTGLAWFEKGGMDDWKPENYMRIRDDFECLKTFLARGLDKGAMDYPVGKGEYESVNYADYAMWLYENCEYAVFKKNFEKAVMQLLAGELNRTFSMPDYKQGMEEALQNFNELHKGDITKAFSNRSVEELRREYGLEKPKNEEEKKFRAWFDEELGRTVRKEPNVYPATHLAETSPAFQEEIKRRYLEKEAREIAVNNYSPQFFRLVGLVDIIQRLGEPDGTFSEAYVLLEQKAKAGFLREAPDSSYSYLQDTSVYNNLLYTLAVLQPDNRLKDFWYGLLKDEVDFRIVCNAITGVLMPYKSNEERQEQLPLILEALHSSEVKKSRVEFALVYLCFNQPYKFLPAHCLEETTATLDVVEKAELKDGKYSLTISRFTPKGRETLQATYNLDDGSIGGDKSLEGVVKEQFKHKGYPVMDTIIMDGFQARRVEKETKIVELSERNLEGVYEGVFSLNGLNIPFLYDAENKKMLLAEPLTYFNYGKWYAAAKIPYEKFADIEETMKRIKTRVDEIQKKPERESYYQIYSLRTDILQEIVPTLNYIVDARIVKLKEGLIE